MCCTLYYITKWLCFGGCCFLYRTHHIIPDWHWNSETKGDATTSTLALSSITARSAGDLIIFNSPPDRYTPPPTKHSCLSHGESQRKWYINAVFNRSSDRLTGPQGAASLFLLSYDRTEKGWTSCPWLWEWLLFQASLLQTMYTGRRIALPGIASANYVYRQTDCLVMDARWACVMLLLLSLRRFSATRPICIVADAVILWSWKWPKHWTKPNSVVFLHSLITRCISCDNRPDAAQGIDVKLPFLKYFSCKLQRGP